MAKDRRTRDQKRKKKLKERKRKERQTESLAYMGGKYKTDKLIPTWMHTEIGIYESYVMTDRRLLDQTVVSALESLIRQIRAGTLPPREDTSEIHYEVSREEDLVIENIRRSWAGHFADEWKPPKDKLIGVLRTILGSIEKVRAPGPRSQSYMRHVEGFLTKKLGVSVKAYSQKMEPIPEPPEDELLTLGRRWILEGDEQAAGIPTTTYVVNVADPANPVFTTSFTNGLPSIDHNLMVRGEFVHEANYSSGLRIFSLCNIANIQEVGFFDTRPENNGTNFQGAWGTDVQLPSGTVLVSDRQRGLFVLDASTALSSFNDKCSVGPPLDLVCDACIGQICALDAGCCGVQWDAQCVQRVRTLCGSLTCAESAGACSHRLCTEGAPLTAGCDVPPASVSCVDAICQQDADCCQTEWTADCVNAVSGVCGLNCD